MDARSDTGLASALFHVPLLVDAKRTLKTAQGRHRKDGLAPKDQLLFQWRRATAYSASLVDHQDRFLSGGYRRWLFRRSGWRLGGSDIEASKCVLSQEADRRDRVKGDG